MPSMTHRAVRCHLRPTGLGRVPMLHLRRTRDNDTQEIPGFLHDEAAHMNAHGAGHRIRVSRARTESTRSFIWQRSLNVADLHRLYTCLTRFTPADCARRSNGTDARRRRLGRTDRRSADDSRAQACKLSSACACGILLAGIENTQRVAACGMLLERVPSPDNASAFSAQENQRRGGLGRQIHAFGATTLA